MIYDVAIIGGGLVGCSAALHLAMRNATVVLLEKGKCGSQASGVNYGGVRQQGRHIAELPLALRSHNIWKSLTKLIGTSCEFTQSGHLKLARSDGEMAELEGYAQTVRPLGLDLQLLGKNKLVEIYPWLSSEVVGGSFCAEDGYANPRLVAPAFSRAARAAGATFHEDTKILGVSRENQHFEVQASSGDSFKAHTLINAAGAWGSSISAQFGEPVPEDVMAPNMCVTDPLPYFLQPNIGVCGGNIYLRQIERGNVIFGGGLGSADRVTNRARPSATVTAEAARLVMQLVPQLKNALLIRSWSGIEGVMPDGLPVISKSNTTPNVIHAFGFSGHGFQLGPGIGEILSEIVLDGETTSPIAAFNIDRFHQEWPIVAATNRSI